MAAPPGGWRSCVRWGCAPHPSPPGELALAPSACSGRFARISAVPVGLRPPPIAAGRADTGAAGPRDALGVSRPALQALERGGGLGGDAVQQLGDRGQLAD